MGWFDQVAPFPSDPSVLVGFVDVPLFGLLRHLFKSNKFRPVTQKLIGQRLVMFVRYGFMLAALLIVPGFCLASYKETNRAVAPVDVGAMIETAEIAHQNALNITRDLAQCDRNNADWWNSLGNSAVERGDLESAETAYQNALNIMQDLAQCDPNNDEWQRDLAVSWYKLGHNAEARGDLESAESAYQNALNIAQDLAKSDPNNDEWQRDLSFRWEKLGDIADARGDLKSAEIAYQNAQNIVQDLAQSDPDNTYWQHDLSVSWVTLGDVLEARGNLEGAETAYQSALNIAQDLTQSDPSNEEWKRHLMHCFVKMAMLSEKQERPDDEIARRYQMALDVAETLESEGERQQADAWIVERLRTLMSQHIH